MDLLCEIFTVVTFLFSKFSFIDADESQFSRGSNGTTFIPLYRFYLLKIVQEEF